MMFLPLVTPPCFALAQFAVSPSLLTPLPFPIFASFPPFGTRPFEFFRLRPNRRPQRAYAQHRR
jgi:hypothetical protein